MPARRPTIGAMAGMLAALAVGTAVGAETIEAVGNLANPAALQAGTARVMAMDATYVGVAEGSAALQWNPGGLGNLAAAETGWHHASGLGGSVAETVLVGIPVGRLGGMAVAVDYRDNGAFESRDANGNLSGTYRAGAFGGTLGWGVPVMKDFAVGAAVRGTQQTLADVSYYGIAGDVGVLWRMLPRLTIGVAWANLGSSGSTSVLATALRAGASYTMDMGTVNHLLLAASTEVQAGGVARVNVGAEDTLFSRLAVRAGYRLDLSDNGLTGLTGLTAGLGVMVGGLALDYAYLPFGELGTSQRVSLTYRPAGRSASRALTEPGGAP